MQDHHYKLKNSIFHHPIDQNLKIACCQQQQQLMLKPWKKPIWSKPKAKSLQHMKSYQMQKQHPIIQNKLNIKRKMGSLLWFGMTICGNCEGYVMHHMFNLVFLFIFSSGVQNVWNWSFLEKVLPSGLWLNPTLSVIWIWILEFFFFLFSW